MKIFITTCACILFAVIKGSEGAIFNFRDDITSNTQQPNIGESVTIPCDVETVLVDVVEWTKDGVDINKTNLTFNLIADNSLQIESYNSKYDGFYRCIAKYQNNTGAVQILASPPILLTSYETRIFTVHPVDHTARLRVDETPYKYEAVVFGCTFAKVFRGSSPIITWQVIESNGDVRNITDFNDDNSGKDVIIQHDHTGYYQRHDPTMSDNGLQARCVATNSENDAEIVRSDWATTNITTEIAVPVRANVFSIKPPTNVYIDSGDEYVRLPCTIQDGRQGNPNTLVWYYEFNILFNNGQAGAVIADVSLFGVTNLQIKVSFIRDNQLNGNFICRTRIVENGASFDESAATRVYVDQKSPAAPAPIVDIEKSQEISAIKNTKTLTVTRPEPVTIVTRLWMNGMLIENSHKHQIESSIDTTSLSIINMSVADSGIYQIEIISGTIHDFSVNQYIIDLSAKVTIDINPVCKEKFVIAPNISSPYNCSPSIPMAQLDTSGELIVNNNIDQSMEGEYKCSAETIQFTLLVTIITSTLINVPTDDMVVSIGTQITLQCGTFDYPVISEYLWTKDEKILQQTVNSTYTNDVVTVDDIGIYECVPVHDQCTLNVTMVQVDVKLPVIKLSPLIEYNETIAPMASSDYNCTPPLLNEGILNEFGQLLIPVGIDIAANGEYICTVDDINGSLYIELIVKSAAYVFNSTEDTVGDLGSSITLQCNAFGIPNTIEYRWTKNGVLLPSETSQNLVFADIGLNDIGEYECMPSNDEGTFNTSMIQLDIRIPLTVDILNDPVSIPTLPPSFDNYTCTPEIPSGYITNNGVLVVAATQLDSSDSREYRCSSNQSRGTFVIDMVFIAPAYITDSTNITIDVDEGTNVTLWCNADGIPKTIEYQWTKDGNTLSNQTTNTYTINDMSLEDIGSYECVPSNAVGTHNATTITVNIQIGVKMNVLIRNSIQVAPASTHGYTCSPLLPNDVILTSNGKLMTPSGLSGTNDSEYRCMSTDFSGSIVLDIIFVAPAFIQSSSSDIIADIGTNTNITCIANGIPNIVSFTWKKNGDIVTGATMATLIISDVSFDDIGEYECIPRNTEGTHSTATTQLDVRVANIDINALSNDVRYVVPPVTSGYDCIPPLPKGELNSMGKLSLDAGLSVDDSGDYRCSSSDINGTVVLNLLVHIPAYITGSSEDTVADFRERVTFECTACGIPNDITFVWRKNGELIVGEVGPTYTIGSVSVSDVGTYECIPNNAYGYHNSSSMALKIKVTEEFDWLTDYILTGKFPSSEQGYRCLPSFSSRLQITNEGHFVTNGLYLEDEQKYICSPLSSDGGSFVFQLLVRGYTPNPVILSKPNFTNDGLAINLNWTINTTSLRPIDRYMLVWRTTDNNGRRNEQTVFTTTNSYTFYNYSTEGTYVFWVIAQNDAGLSDPSNEWSFNIGEEIGGIERDTPVIEVWLIVLIVICTVFLLLICCICCFVCLVYCMTRRNGRKVYYAEREEAKNAEELQKYRQAGDESDDSDSTDSEDDKPSIKGD